MCVPSPSTPQGPSKAELERMEADRRKQRQLLEEERRTQAQMKQESLELAQAQAAGRRGRRSLLTGRKGGSGFDIADQYKTKTTLGA